MYKQHLLQNIKREIDLLKQLAPFIEEKDLEFRPNEKLRSTLELMQYLSTIGSVIIRRFIKNDITPEMREKTKEHWQTLTIQNFSARLDEQLVAIEEFMSEVTDEDLFTKEIELPWKEKMTLGAAIINCPIKWLAAYRMELFVYLKTNGKADLGTKEAWVLQAS